MRKLYTISAGLMLAFYFLVAPVIAAPLSEKHQQQKIKHPTEAMSKDQHAAVLNAMRGKRNDAEKVAALKEGVKDKGITIDQLITLLNQFLTDDAKLECAQFAFPYTTDYKNFLKIMDLFSQESYKERLEEFYGKNKK